MTEMFITGIGMAPFANHGPGAGMRLGMHASLAALEDAGMTFADVDALYVGSANALSPRAIQVARELGMTGIPVQDISNASASGLAALHEAWLAIGAGQARHVLVLGLDAPSREVSVEEIIVSQGNYPPVVSFALWAQRRMHETGLTPQHLAKVTAKNWNYARDNPFAARRSSEPVTMERVLESRMVAAPLTSMMCTSWGEGAAAVILSAAPNAPRHDTTRPPVRFVTSEFQTDRFSSRQILDGAIVGPPELTQKTAKAALDRAGLSTTDIDVVQIHDAFAIEEILYYELLGFSKPGETEGLVDQGAFGPGSREKFGLPEFSTDGGLIARGHPGGPTGIAQIWETTRRLRLGRDRHGLCHLLGAGSVCIVQVLSRH